MGCSQGKPSKEIGDSRPPPPQTTCKAPELPPTQRTQAQKALSTGSPGESSPAKSFAHVAQENENKGTEGDPRPANQPFDRFWLGMHTWHGINLAALAQNPSFVKINQDRAMVVWPFDGSYGKALIGLFDGHGDGGEHAAEACCRHVPAILAKELASCDPKEALIRSCMQTDTLLVDKSDDAFFFAGTTATLIYMSKGQALGAQTTMWIAGAGDSRCVRGTFKDGNVIPMEMTIDHKASLPDEAARLVAAGSKIVDGKMYIDLEDGFACLDMSRSIGDGLCKQHGVIAEPDVQQVNLDSDMVDGTQFLVVASDGLWDVIGSQDTCDIVASSSGAQDACNRLVSAALDAWKVKNRFYRDDITVVVVFLPLLHPEWDEAESLSAVTAAAAVLSAPPAPSPSALGRRDSVRSERRSSVSSVVDGKEKAPRRLSAEPRDLEKLPLEAKDGAEKERKSHVVADINMGGMGIKAMAKDELPEELRHFAETNMDDAPDPLAVSFVNKKKSSREKAATGVGVFTSNFPSA